jgi:uncharacterized protein (TIGR02118 family)
MVRLLYCLRRREGVSQEEFREHWLDHHVPTYGEPITAIRRYVLYPAIDAQQSYDGIASVWFDDVAALTATMDGAMPEAAKDEARFIDHDRSRAVLATDRVVIEPTGQAGVVLFQCLVAAPGVAREEFDRAWREEGGRRVAEARDAGILAGYVQSVADEDKAATRQFDRLGDQRERWDGIGATYFDSVLLAREYLAAADPLDTFADPERTVSFLARRHPFR